VTPDRLVLISDFRYDEQIAREAPWVELILRSKGMADEVAKTFRKLKLPRVGVQAESMTLGQRDGLLALFKDKKKGGVKLTPVSNIIIELRHIKDAHEIAILEGAIAAAEGAFNATRAQIKIGMTEGEIAGLLGFEMRKRGALNSSFDSIVAVGPNGSLPHYRPTDVPLTGNTSLLIDWGALYQKYCSDLTRVLFFGDPSPKMREIYRVTLDAQMAAIEAIKPGKKAKAIDKVARDVITKAGYGKQFGHGLGHGIGRDIHEPIAFNKLSKITLKPGMVLTVEPGIYLPGVGGVRIEDDILVTETGYKVLTTLPKSLEWARMGA
jgi:Xaa-Pro aminopeptidase